MAVAARLAAPDRAVVAALGDGTFGFHAFELDTAARYGLPIVAVVGNDARWNAEHQLQIQHYGAERTVGCELCAVALRRARGVRSAPTASTSSAPEELEPALARALASGPGVRQRGDRRRGRADLRRGAGPGAQPGAERKRTGACPYRHRGTRGRSRGTSWDPTLYLKFSDHRLRPALELLDRVPIATRRA